VVSWCRGLRASEGNTLILLFVRERDCSCSATSEQHGNKEKNRFKNKEHGSVLLQANKMRTKESITASIKSKEQHEDGKFFCNRRTT
jgi:hypothetical protein